MRLPPPKTLKMDADALLRDLRERLAERLPSYAEHLGDPTDPGWLLMEQAAWMVQALSEQLDRWPLAAIQQFTHLLGARIRPSQPSVGVVTLLPKSSGTLRWDPERPCPYRFFTPRTETSDSIEFVPIERDVPLSRLDLGAHIEIVGGELYLAGAEPGREPDVGVSWRGKLRRAETFLRERVRFRLVAVRPDELAATLEQALAKFAELKIGWLKLEISGRAEREVQLDAWIDLNGPFAQTAPGGLAPGGDLEGDWGGLDDISWTPPVRISERGSVPPWLRGRHPLPSGENRILVPDLPAHHPIAGLLETRAGPMPDAVCQAIWSTLVRVDLRLAAWRPAMERVYGEPAPGEPDWLDATLESGLYWRFSPGPSTVVEVKLRDAPPTRVRVGVVVEAADENSLPPILVFGRDVDGRAPSDALPARRAWTLPLPSSESDRGMLTVIALDVDVPEQVRGLLVAAPRSLVALILNPVLAGNLPYVRDGRRVVVERNVPRAASLLYENVVNREVIRNLLHEAIPAQAAEHLSSMRLAWMPVVEQEPIVDYEGVNLDPVAALMTLNGVDELGHQRTFRPGTAIQLAWYCRTDGARGNVPAGLIRSAEQEAGTRPEIAAVSNPLGTWYGGDREDGAEAMERLFGPASALPVLPSDFEREVRIALGARAQGWVVRCWAWSERALVSTALWPLPALGDPVDVERRDLEAELEKAGPEKLLVVVGLMDALLDPAEFDWARRTIRRMAARLGQRLPAIRDAIVARFHPLILESETPPSALVMPCFVPDGTQGRLVDTSDRERSVPAGTLFLNAAVVRVKTPRRSATWNP